MANFAMVNANYGHLFVAALGNAPKRTSYQEVQAAIRKVRPPPPLPAQKRTIAPQKRRCALFNAKAI